MTSPFAEDGSGGGGSGAGVGDRALVLTALVPQSSVSGGVAGGVDSLAES